MREYKTIRALREGRSVEVEGLIVCMVAGDIEPGDTYVGERNVGPRLLTAETINKEGGWINPKELAYNYDIGECVKVDLTHPE
jgi:hypothetical protein